MARPAPKSQKAKMAVMASKEVLLIDSEVIELNFEFQTYSSLNDWNMNIWKLEKIWQTDTE